MRQLMLALTLAGYLILPTHFHQLLDTAMAEEDPAACAWNKQSFTLRVGTPEARDIRVIEAGPLGPEGKRDLQVIGDAVGLYYTHYEQKKRESPDKLSILAWSVKAYTANVPPEVIDEVIVLAEWKEKGCWSLCYLYRKASESNRLHGGWQNDAEMTLAGLPWQEEFTTRPTEAEIVRFVRKTNFGNNEMMPNLLVASVFLYENTLPGLRQELSKGVDRKEKASRYNHYSHGKKR